MTYWRTLLAEGKVVPDRLIHDHSAVPNKVRLRRAMNHHADQRRRDLQVGAGCMRPADGIDEPGVRIDRG